MSTKEAKPTPIVAVLQVRRWPVTLPTAWGMSVSGGAEGSVTLDFEMHPTCIAPKRTCRVQA